MLSNLGSLPAELCTVVRPFFCSMLHLDCDARVALVNEEYVHLRGRLVASLGDKGAGSSPQLGEAGRWCVEEAFELPERRCVGSWHEELGLLRCAAGRPWLCDSAWLSCQGKHFMHAV